MAVLVLTSAGGSPGTTTLAVGLSLAWPRSVLLADADPGAHQSVLAGYLAGQSPQGKGLLRVAEAHRERRSLPEVIMDQTLPLADDPNHSRLYLPGFSKPGSAGLFSGVWLDLVEAFDRLGDSGIDVIVDAGRLTGSGLPPALVEYAALTTLVVRSSLRSIMSAKVYGPTLLDHSRFTAADQSVGLVVVGEGQPYGASEISRALGLPVLAAVADDRPTAAHFSDGAPRPRKFDSSPLARSLHTATSALHGRVESVADRVRSQP